MGVTRRNLWSAFAALSLLLSPAAGFAKARPQRKEPIAATNTAVAKIMADYKFPGAALLVMRKGEIIAQKGYGLANIEHGAPVTSQTMFQSGSVGKIFTASAAMRLAEQGKWKLTDPICPHLPQCPGSWKEITFDQLIRHTSGIADWEHAGKQGEIVKALDYRKDYSDADFLKIAQSLPLDFQPGTDQSYSNTAYVVLGIAINRAAGMHYSEYLAHEVFTPAGMPTARLLSDVDIVPNRAAGYEIFQSQIRNQSWNSASINSTADGSLYLSLNDYASWIRWLPKESVNRPEYEAANRLSILPNGNAVRYDGLGWVAVDEKGKRIKEKTGQWQGFRSYVFWVPDEEFAVVFLINGCVVDKDGNSTEPGILDFGRALVSQYRPQTGFAPRN
jgi:CubicO group peptidase (beta-lactamase class C family)